jgi:type IV pilus assembly protein PilB
MTPSQEALKKLLIEKLTRTTLFVGLDDAQRARVAAIAQLVSFQAGELLVTQGTPSDHLLILLQGRARVLVEEAVTGVQLDVGELGEGDTVGEIGLLLGEVRTASVQATEAVSAARLSREAFDRLLLEEAAVGLITAQNLARLLADRSRNAGFRTVKLRDHPFDPELYDLFPRRLLSRLQVVPFGREGTTILIATPRPTDPAIFSALKEVAPGLRFRPHICSAEDYDRYDRFVMGPVLDRRPQQKRVEVDVRDYRAAEVKIGTFHVEESGPRALAPGDKVVEALNTLLAAAVNQGASDVHIEPGDERALIRLRINGALEIYQRTEMSLAIPLVQRIKVAAGLDIAERRLPHDGRARVRLRDRLIELRVSTMPSVYGEKAVLRILDAATGLRPLDQLIVSPALLGNLRRTLLSTSGCVVVCGPTGSGKTTTLYSSLRELVAARPDVSVGTIEDPVEYTLSGITQTHVNEAAGLTFPVVLRSMLRQDPDVILVGEMRDETTAQIALEASLTGHLVLTTVHANSTIEAAVRLIEMGCRPYLVASALSMVVGQRLLRRLCPLCRQRSQPSKLIRSHLAEAGILPEDAGKELWSAVGCSACKGTGFVGRVAAYEFLQVNDHLREAIGARELGPSLRALAESDKALISFKRYSQLLLSDGATTPAEVLRHFGS